MKKAYCLFECNNTFRDELKKRGYDAKSYSLNIEGQINFPDFNIDLFKSDLSFIEKKSLVCTFFPCNKFNTLSELRFKGCNGVKVQEKAIKARNEYLQELLRELKILQEKNCKIIFENPINYENRFLKNELLNIGFNVLEFNNRIIYGDKFKKPTYFFYYNLEFNNDLQLITYTDKKILTVCKGSGKKKGATYRKENGVFIDVSEIEIEFVNNLLNMFEL